MRLRRSLCGMLDIVHFRLDQRCPCSILQNVVVEIPLVVDLVDELVDAGRGLGTAALERLWGNDLAVVDHELLVEGGCGD
jgi:hypothetical protein